MLLDDARSLDLDAALAHFAAHGYARLGRVLDDAGLASLRERVDDVLLGRVAYPGLFFQRDSMSGRYDDLTFGLGWQGPSPAYRKVEKVERDPRFLSWIENPLFERIARRLIDGDVAIYRAALFVKAASGGTELPWHQDGGLFWGIDRDPTLQVWTALDDAPVEAGCIEVVPGSHAGGLVTRAGGMVAAAALAAADAEAHSVALPARAGEALLVHNHVWHRSGVNRSGHPRRALSVCYMSAATRCLRKKHEPRSFVRVFQRV
jgi:ectoine hydroxylase-related dioxygenase (phytanoyl-CoA dioxygenase family)